MAASEVKAQTCARKDSAFAKTYVRMSMSWITNSSHVPAGPATRSVKAQKRARAKARKAAQPMPEDNASENVQNVGNMNTNGVHAGPSAMQTDPANDQVSFDLP